MTKPEHQQGILVATATVATATVATATATASAAIATTSSGSALPSLFGGIADLAPLLRAGTAVLTPNRRLSRAVREAELDWRQGEDEQCWDSSIVMPLEQYWLARWSFAVTLGLIEPLRILDTLQQRLLWEQIINNDPGQFSLLSPAKAAALCQQALQTLLLWRVDLQAANVRQLFEFDDDGRVFLAWAREFVSLLKDLHCCMPEQAMAQLLEGELGVFDRPLALLCVDELSPLYLALCAQAPSWQHVQHVQPRADDATGLEIGEPETRRKAAVNARAFADKRSELRAAARWCREQHQANPEGRYAVVLSDMREDRDRLEFFLRQEFDCLTREYDSLPVNFATGFALDRTPIIRDALAILECSAAEVLVEQYIGVLQSRFIAADLIGLVASRPGLTEAHVRALRELCAERVSQRLLRQVLSDCDERFRQDEGNAAIPPWKLLRSLETEFGLRKRKRLPSEWLAVINAILASWAWPNGRTLDSLEYQQIQQWHSGLETFTALDTLCGRISYEACVRRLRGLLAEKPFQPQTPDRALQVLGPLETTGLVFDGIWVVGMSSAQWPSSARPNPYIPVSLQRQHRMPHADADWESAWSTKRWQQWLWGCKNLRVSFVNLAEGIEVQPSPLLQGLDIASEEHGIEFNPRWAAQQETMLPSAVALSPLPLLSDEPCRRGVGAYTLEHQANCAFRAFAAVRLRAEAAAVPAVGLLPSERGILLHRALYTLFGILPDRQSLRDCSAAERQAAIEAAVADAQKGLRSERRQLLGPAVLALEDQRLGAVLAQWLLIEDARPEDFAVAAREQAREFELEGLTLRLRIDRLDTLSGGQQVVVDYKSGQAENLARWFGERPTRPQLPLYALLEPPAEGIAYAVLKTGQLGFSGVAQHAFAAGIDEAAKRLKDVPVSAGTGAGEDADADTDTQPAAMQVLREHWKTSLGALAKEFLAGEAAVNPVADACRYCHRQALCRVGDARS